MSLELEFSNQLETARKYVKNSKPNLCLSPRGASSDVANEMREAVRHCHFSVSPDMQRAIISDNENWHVEYLTDTYSDSRNNTLLQENIWLRIRNGQSYSFKTVDKDHNNVLMAGPVQELVCWALTRLLFTLDIVRYHRKGNTSIWVDFVTIEDDKGQMLHDCVAAVCGDAPVRNDFGPPRCGSAFIAAKDLHVDGLVLSDSGCTAEHALRARPLFWPEWRSPFKPMSEDDRLKAHEFAIAVREHELAKEKSEEDLCDN